MFRRGGGTKEEREGLRHGLLAWGVVRQACCSRSGVRELGKEVLPGCRPAERGVRRLDRGVRGHDGYGKEEVKWNDVGGACGWGSRPGGWFGL